LTVSGAIAFGLNPGASCSLGDATILIGSDKKPEDVVAKFKVKLGQTCRLKIKLKTYSFAKDAGPLESGTFEFQIDGAEVPGGGGDRFRILERRVRQLDKEVRDLRAAVESLQKQKGK
jgi:hypothetical protein